MRRWRATVGAGIAAVALTCAIVAGAVGSAPSGTDPAAPHELRFEDADPFTSRSRSEGYGLDIPADEVGGTAGAGSASTPAAAPAPAPGEVVIAPPPARFDGPPPAPVAPPPALRQLSAATPSGGVWAVMIGIDDYPGTSSDLRSAVNDVNDVNEALARFGVPGDHRLLIRNGEASAAVILAAVDWLVARAGQEAKAVFFFAGHVRKVSTNTEAMVGADGRLVTDAQLAQRLAGLQAHETWVALAACYSGGFTEVLREGVDLVAAAPKDALAYENDRYKRSYLVQFMVRQAMIEGKAPSSVQAAFDYAKAEIDRLHPGRAPVELDRSDGNIDLRQGGTSSPSSPPPPPPGGSSPPSSTPPPDDCTRVLGVVTTCGRGS